MENIIRWFKTRIADALSQDIEIFKRHVKDVRKSTLVSKKKRITIGLCKKVDLSTISLVRFTVLIVSLVLLSGCVGLLVTSMGKSMATEDTFGEVESTLPPMTDGNGRLYIYRTEESTETSIRYGLGIVKNPTLCTVDDTAYELIWEAFKYIDLPEGLHQLTCGSDVIKEVEFWSGKEHYQRGTNKVEILILNATETFVRVDGTEEEPYFQPILVEERQGREEMVDLPFQSGSFEHIGGKISDQ